MDRQADGVAANSHVGAILKQLRKDKKITLQTAADAVGVSPSYIHRLENNTRQNPSIKVATQLAVLYDVNLEEFTGQASLKAGDEWQTELDQAIESMKKGIALLQKLDEQDNDTTKIKKHFVNVQKSLLYLKSVL